MCDENCQMSRMWIWQIVLGLYGDIILILLDDCDVLQEDIIMVTNMFYNMLYLPT